MKIFWLGGCEDVAVFFVRFITCWVCFCWCLLDLEMTVLRRRIPAPAPASRWRYVVKVWWEYKYYGTVGVSFRVVVAARPIRLEMRLK